MKRLGIASLFMVAGLFAGCGGSGDGDDDKTISYTGSTDPVAITAGNAEPIAEGATEASNQMVQEYEANENNPFGVGVTATTDARARAAEIGLMLLKNNQGDQLPVGAVYTAEQLNTQAGEYAFCSGSVAVSDSLENSTGEEPSGSGTITFNDLCIVNFDDMGNNAVMDGSMEIAWGQTYSRVAFSNFTLTQVGQPAAVINGEMSCTWEAGTGANYTCTWGSVYEGRDGKVYKVEFELGTGGVYDGGDLGWTVSAKVYHPGYGYVTISAENVKFECGNGRPSTGTLSVDGPSGGSVDITFVDCETYTGTYTTSSGDTGTLSGW